jgi:hypothetical protein
MRTSLPNLAPMFQLVSFIRFLSRVLFVLLLVTVLALKSTILCPQGEVSGLCQ